jgi:hypothetical protein
MAFLKATALLRRMGGAIVAEFAEEVMWLGRYNIQLYAQGFTLS